MEERGTALAVHGNYPVKCKTNGGKENKQFARGQIMLIIVQDPIEKGVSEE